MKDALNEAGLYMQQAMRQAEEGSRQAQAELQQRLREKRKPGSSDKPSNLPNVKQMSRASFNKNASNPPNVSFGGDSASRTRPNERL